MHLRVLFIIVLTALVLLACSGSSDTNGPQGQARSYYLGFTPFPYAATSQAVEYSYSKIATDCDLAAHHFDDGIPWPEALSGDDLHPNIVADWQYRKAGTPANHKIYLSITPINIGRDALAPYKAEEGDMALPSPWDSYSFDHPDVKAAYLNYCRRAIDFFEPDFAVIGIEVNLLMVNDPSLQLWDDYVELHKSVYPALKSEYPDLPIMLSFTGMDLLEGYTEANHQEQMQGLDELIEYSDYFGLSIYTYISALLADSVPDGLFDDIFALSDKPVAICETAYPAQEFSILAGSLVFNGTPQKQQDYFEMLFEAADRHSLEFIINFVIRDYDQLWVTIGSPDDVNKLWRDTGLYDENGNPRPALTTWKDKLAHTVK